MTLLDIISAHLSEEDDDIDSRSIIDEKALISLAEIFEKDCHHVIKFAAGEEDKENSDFKVSYDNKFGRKIVNIHFNFLLLID